MNYDELKAALSQLPTDEDAPNRVPEPLSFHLSQRKRVARTRLNLPWTEYRLLAALALSGWSLRYGLIQAEAAMQGQHPRNGTFIRAGAHLEKAGLWQVMTVRLNASVSLVQLTPLGRQLLTEIGVTPVYSEWEELQQRHRGGQGQRHHNAAICLFAYHARLRGYEVRLCPNADGQAEPDVQLERDGELLYVEVQGRGGEIWQRTEKWWNAYRLQGESAICTVTPAQAIRYAEEAQRAGVPRGRVTNLETLYLDAPASLWTHEWKGRSHTLQRVVSHERVCGFGQDAFSDPVCAA
ncbi:MAG: hypothetical protein ACO3Z6_14230 [Pseudomonadales bacterium]